VARPEEPFLRSKNSEQRDKTTTAKENMTTETENTTALQTSTAKQGAPQNS